MNRALVALKLCDDLPDVPGDWIGCDRGTLFLIDQGIPVTAAIGDFDSVTPEEKKRILERCGNVRILPAVKDDTDSEAAVRFARELGYDEIWLAGCFGGRTDHTVINLRLAQKYPGQVILYDRQNLVMAAGEGEYILNKNGWQYVSVFTSDTAVITLAGMKYPLDHRRITGSDLYTVSNEITGDTGKLTVHEGIVLVIMSRDIAAVK